jgi:hypothetical protein
VVSCHLFHLLAISAQLKTRLSTTRLIGLVPALTGLRACDRDPNAGKTVSERGEPQTATSSFNIKTMPQLLGLNADENLESKLSWLQQRLSLDDKSLSVVAQRKPQLLGCNVETNPEPTMKFYEECVGLDAARTLIAYNPSLLSRSLDKRLKPRLAECQEAGVSIDTGTLGRTAMCTGEKWLSSMAFQNAKLLKQQLLNR